MPSQNKKTNSGKNEMKPDKIFLINSDYDQDGCAMAEIAPGIFWQSEIAQGDQSEGSRILDERNDGTRAVVRLNDRFRPGTVKEYLGGKAYHISGEVNGQPSEFTLLKGRNGLLYAVGSDVKTYRRGRVQPFHATEISRFSEKSKQFSK